MDLWKDPSLASKAIPRYLDAVIQIVPSDKIDEKWANNIYRSSKSNRQYDNEFVVVQKDDGLYLIVETDQRDLLPRPFVLYDFWNNYLWPLYTLTYFFRSKKGVVGFVGFFLWNTNELELLLTKPIRVILLAREKCIASIDLDLGSANPEIWSLLDTRPPMEAVCDDIAAKAWAMGRIAIKGESLREQLEFGWANRLQAEVEKGIRFLRDPVNLENFANEREMVKETRFGEFFESDQNCAAHLYNYFQKLYTRKNLDLIKAISAPTELSDAPYHKSFIGQLIQCAWFSGKGTARGQKIRSFELDGTIRQVDLEAEKLKDRSKVFWERIPFDFPFYYNQLVGGGSCPIDINRFVERAPLYEGDISEGEEFVNNLLAEAVSLKQWTIPFGAYVQLEVGDIKAVKIYDISQDVACVLINQSGDYYLVWVDPYKQVFAFLNYEEMGFAVSARARMSKETQISNLEELLQRIELGIKLPLAAIIRDFWVVEERERVFGASVRKRRSIRLRSDFKEETIVYIPRIRYVGDAKDKEEGLNLAARKPHFVVGHLRKAMQASKEQILLARRYGIFIPEGFTFVRPHRRGDKAQERVYRSRSALQCIRALDPPGQTQHRDQWFQYELNVKNWLKDNKYDVDHIAANRNGDGGVDIQASKGNENLLLQCKYWFKSKIGPRVIREMLGTLQTFPEDSKGVIVTSSELTPKARSLARKHGIQFIERVDFENSIRYKL